MSRNQLTSLLRAARDGDSSARGEVIQAAYEDLRDLAAKRMRDQRQDHTLTATALVHEVSVRLLDGQPTPDDRTGFFAYASRAMRNLLVDHARARNSQKRGGEAVRFSLDQAGVGTEQQPDEVLAVNDALDRLADFDERKAKVVEMRYFGGLTNRETADSLGVSEGTVKRDWELARAWLRRCLQSGEDNVEGSS